MSRSPLASVSDFLVPLPRSAAHDAKLRRPSAASLRLKFITAAIIGLPIYYLRRLFRR